MKHLVLVLSFAALCGASGCSEPSGNGPAGNGPANDTRSSDTAGDTADWEIVSDTSGGDALAQDTDADAAGADMLVVDTTGGDTVVEDTDGADMDLGNPDTDQGCGVLGHGDTETRTFYDVPSVPLGEDCTAHEEQRSRSCTDGVLSAFSGTFPYESCYVRNPSAPRPDGDLLENFVLEAGSISVSGVGDNLSGVTWNGLTGSYFAVINDALVVEFLSPTGSSLVLEASWPIENRQLTDDYEGIAWIEDDIFVISDERNDRAVFVRIQAGAGAIDLDQALLTIAFPEQAGGNSGLEGIGFAPGVGECGALFAVQETPYELYRFVLPCVSPGVIEMSSDIDHSLSDRALFRLPGFGQSQLRNCYWTGTTCDSTCTTCDKIDVQDFAGITYVPSTGRVIIVSENVGIKRGGAGTTEYIDLLTEVGPDSSGDWGATWMTELPQHQAEGVAIGEGGELLVVSEPNIVLRLLVP